MFSWLGLGQKEEKQKTEESNNENVSVVKPEEIVADVLIETVVEAETDAVAEEATEQSIHNDVIEETGCSEEINTDISEPITESTSEMFKPTDAVITELEQQVAETTETVEESSTVVEKLSLEPVEIEHSEGKLVQDTDTSEAAKVDVVETKAIEKLGFFARLKQGLSKTRQNLGGGLVDLFRGKQIDDELFEELETHLLMADVGVETTMKIIDSLTQSASRKQLKDATALYDLLKVELKKIIEDVSQPLVIPESDGPFVMLMVGVNGVGKTTTIGKLAKQFQAQGKSVMLAAGDTFRAAAVEQLQVWGERNDIPVIAQHTGADSASVIFDAISAAKARNVDVIIADTAGRLQNKAHLMEELKKVVRVMKKLDVNAPHEVMLTLDAGTGQNALSQTKLFDEAVGLTGLTLTKLDGTAKGGVVFAVADKHNIPIRYLGVGEGIDDLRPFNSDDFIDAIFSQ